MGVFSIILTDTIIAAMQKKIYLLTSLVFILAGCHQISTTEKNAAADPDFQQLSDSFITGYLDWRPQQAVNLGLHEYDGKLTDLSKKSIMWNLARLNEYDQKLSNIDTMPLGKNAL